MGSSSSGNPYQGPFGKSTSGINVGQIYLGWRPDNWVEFTIGRMPNPMVYTPMVYGRGMTPELREKRRKRSLLQIEGTGWDVGKAVVYLASDQARWVTGVVLPVDAGATAGWLPVA